MNDQKPSPPVGRVRFWAKALRQGAVQLNSVAGWASTTILLAGVIAGIAVPVLLHLPDWLIAVILLSLLVLVLAEGAYRVWHEADQARADAVTEQNEAQAEMARRFDGQRHALTFDSVHSITHPAPHHATGTVELRLHLSNNSNDPLRFEVEDMSVTIDGQFSPPDAPMLNCGGVIGPHDIAKYRAPPISHVRIPWQQGILEATVRYGPTTGPLRFRTARRWSLRHFGVAGAPPGQGDQVYADVLGDPAVEDI